MPPLTALPSFNRLDFRKFANIASCSYLHSDYFQHFAIGPVIAISAVRDDRVVFKDSSDSCEGMAKKDSPLEMQNKEISSRSHPGTHSWREASLHKLRRKFDAMLLETSERKCEYPISIPSSHHKTSGDLFYVERA